MITRRRRVLRRVAIGVVLLAFAVFALFCANGTMGAWREPRLGETGALVRQGARREVRVFALNAAKCDFHTGGLSFASAAIVRARLDEIAAAVRAERADLVFLSEVVSECGPVPVDQVEYLAQACDFAFWASGDNYSFGLPFFRIRSGNALLSAFPLRALEIVQLAGGRPFWSPTNNRRVLWCEVEVDGAWLLAASLRNDSFDLVNNAVQARELLAYAGARPALLAGDFNAAPGTPPLELYRASGRFTGFADAPTFPASAPARRLDQILAPAEWRVVEQHLVDTGVSDHLAVVSTFALR